MTNVIAESALAAGQQHCHRLGWAAVRCGQETKRPSVSLGDRDAEQPDNGVGSLGAGAGEQRMKRELGPVLRLPRISGT